MSSLQHGRLAVRLGSLFSWPTIAVPLGMAIAAGLGVHLLGEKDLWLDEATSERFSRIFIQRLPSVPATDGVPNMDLFYGLLALWRQLGFGDSEFALRLLSVIFAVATIPLFFVVGRRLFGSNVAALATLLLSVNVVFIRYAQELRAYSLLILFAVASTYLFIRACDRPSFARWMLYAGVSALSLYDHFFAAPVLVGHFAVLAALSVRRLFAVRVVAAYMSVAFLGLPLAAAIALNGTCQIDHIEAPTVQGFFSTLAATAGGQHAVSLVLIAVAVGLLGLISARARHERFELLVTVSWLVAPLCVALAISLLQPILHPRYVVSSLPALILLASLGIVRCRPRIVAAVGLAIMIGLSGVSLADWYRMAPVERWEEATRHVVGDARPTDAVIFYTRSGQKPFSYYVRRSGSTFAAPIAVWTPKKPCGDVPDPVHEAELLAIADGSLNRHQRIWLVISHIDPLLPPYDLVALAGRLDGEYQFSQQAFFGESRRSGHLIEVRLYVRDDQTASPFRAL